MVAALRAAHGRLARTAAHLRAPLAATMAAGVVEHYGQGEQVLPRIVAGLEKLGSAPEQATIEDVSPADEFHIGGVPAAKALFEQLAIEPQQTCGPLALALCPLPPAPWPWP